MFEISVGDRVVFINLLGLREELLVEHVEGNRYSGRGITVVGSQIVNVNPS
jgi:hypothetical protein